MDSDSARSVLPLQVKIRLSEESMLDASSRLVKDVEFQGLTQTLKRAGSTLSIRANDACGLDRKRDKTVAQPAAPPPTTIT